MAHAYERMRDKFIADGMEPKAAKAKAARIWNSKHPEDPITRDYSGGETSALVKQIGFKEEHPGFSISNVGILMEIYKSIRLIENDFIRYNK